MRNQTIKTYILAGGKSSRMGTDKSKIVVNSKSFLQRIIEAVEPICKNIAIVGAAEISLKYPQIKDLQKNLGPIGGLYTALKHSDKDLNLVLSCDVPLISTKLLQSLVDAWQNDCDVLLYKTGDKIMSLVALYRKNCLENCKMQIKKGDLKMMHLLEILKCKTIDAEEEAWRLSNINTPKELENLKHKFG